MGSLEPWYKRKPIDCKTECKYFKSNFENCLIVIDENGSVAPDGMNCKCEYCERIVLYAKMEEQE